jgi:hypothetical protein
VGGRGGFEEEVEDGCGRLTDEAAAAPSKRRRSRKRDKAATNNNDNLRRASSKGIPEFLLAFLAGHVCDVLGIVDISRGG